MKLNIGIDATFVIKDKRGMGRFVRNLLKKFYLIDQDINFTLMYNSAFESYENIKEFNKVYNWNIASFREHINLDIMWFPWSRIDILQDYKKIVNIYDVNPFIFLNSSSKQDQKRIKYAAENSDLIMTTSYFSRSEIVKYLGVDQDKVKVVYPGIDDVFRDKKLDMKEREALRNKYCICADYILYVGTEDKRKNIKGLINAFREFKKENHSDIKLVIAGDFHKRILFNNLINNDIFSQIKKLKLEKDIIIVENPDDEKLNDLYNTAEIFVFPSFYEGFGFQVVEAMKTALPVACSRGSSLSEIAADAAEYFDPEDTKELSYLINKLIINRDLRSDMVKKGLIISEIFSFEKCALDYMKIFKNIIVKNKINDNS